VHEPSAVEKLAEIGEGYYDWAFIYRTTPVYLYSTLDTWSSTTFPFQLPQFRLYDVYNTIQLFMYYVYLRTYLHLNGAHTKLTVIAIV